MFKSKKGFTILELLIVVAIIGILSAIILAALSTSRSKARDATRISDIHQLQNALELYAVAHSNTYPVSSALLSTALVPAYIRQIPLDPSNGVAYAYVGLGSAANCSGYHLGASLQNKTSLPVNDADYDSTNDVVNAYGAGLGAATRCGTAGSWPAAGLRGQNEPGTGGSDLGCKGTVDVGTYCYDVKR